MKLYSLCFRTLADMLGAVQFLSAQRPGKIEVYTDSVPQITFAARGNALGVDLAFFLNDNGIRATWIREGDPVEETTWKA